MILLGALLSGITLGFLLWPAKTITSPRVLPISIASNTPTTITVSARVSPNLKLIGNSITVVRLNQEGAPIVTMGILKDDGMGTHTYTGQFQITESGPSNVYFMVTSVSKNSLLLAKSPIFALMVKSAPIFPLKKSSNNRFFVDQTNMPLLVIGDAPMSIVSMLRPTQQDFYFADRQAMGFNALWINMLCTSYTGCPADGRTAGGIAPFTSGNSPANYDLSMPNDTYFALYDAAIASAAKFGHVVFLNPIETGGWLSSLKNNGAMKAFNYGVYVGNRYKNFPNIVWLHGNDYGCGTSTINDTLVAQVMAGIASVDSNHLQTVEAGSATFAPGMDAYAWSNMCMGFTQHIGADLAYSWAPTYDVALRAYNSSPTLPCFLGEGNYEFENIQSVLAQPTGAYLLRETVWWTLLSGCMGYIYGSRFTWTSTWPSNVLDSPGATQITNINAMMNGLEWWKLVPDENHVVTTAGYGTYTMGNSDPTANTYCSTGSASDGSFALTYCPKSTTLTVALDRLKSPVTARWFDPAAGTFSVISGSPFANNKIHNFSTPRNNSSGDPDWILVLTAAKR